MRVFIEVELRISEQKTISSHNESCNGSFVE